MTAEPATILVVEDEGIVAKELQHTLGGLGYRVPATAQSSDDAVRLATELRPDLVLMDIRIKGERDGIETASILRQQLDVPVVFLTAYADVATVTRARETEPYGYLLKPIKEVELRTAIELGLFKRVADQRLRQRERWFSTTLRAISDAVIATDASGNVTFLNPGAAELVGVAEDKATGRPLMQVFRAIDEQTREPIRDPLLTVLGERRATELPAGTVIAGPTGDRAIADSAAPIVDERDELLGAVLVFRDVTQERSVQARLAMTDRLASLGTLAAGVAHEINNPLAAIVADTDYIGERLRSTVAALARGDLAAERSAAGMHELIDVIEGMRGGLQRVARIVADLRTFSQPQDDAIAAIDVRDVLHWAMRIVNHHLVTRARVITKLGPCPRVLGSGVRLGQVFVNLLVNAGHALAEGREGGNEVRITSGTDEQGRVVVAITDNGTGIPPHVQRRVFEPFFTTKPVGQGTGLGLAVCHGIVQSLGGEIEIDSEVGVGTTVRVRLPAASTAFVATETPAANRGRSPGRARVLVIDDEPLLASAVRRILERDHDVTIITDASEAMGQLADGRDFDVVLCDLAMPGMSGMDLFEQARARDPKLAERFVFLTGGAWSSRAKAFLEGVPNAHVAKPFQPAVLREIVARTLARRAHDA
jgi:PAS domain S-box-containing protein